MINLPSIPELIRRTKALAALDLILSPDKQYRYHSFNAHWSSDEQMANMWDGCGDEWSLVFHKAGWAVLNGLGHESEAWSKGREKLSAALKAALPPEFKDFAEEPAFAWNATSFAYYCLSDSKGWKRVNDLTSFANIRDTGDADVLSYVTGSAQDYAEFLEYYFERPVSVETVTSIFALKPITSEVVTELNSSTSLAELSSQLFDDIAYPRQL